jgi:PAS domain S-box-containing protein
MNQINNTTELIKILTESVNNLIENNPIPDLSEYNFSGHSKELSELAESIQNLSKKNNRNENKTEHIGFTENEIIENNFLFPNVNSISNRYSEVFSELKLSFAIFETINDIPKDKDKIIFVGINDVFEKTTGLKQEQVIGKDIRDVFPFLFELWGEKFAAVLEKKAAERFEVYSDEIDRYLYLMIFKTLDDKLAVVFYDITKQKEYERENKLHTDIIESIAECVVVKDLDDRIVYVNNAFVDVYGYQKEEVIGHDISILYSELNEDIEIPAMLWNSWKGHLWQRKKDGTAFYSSYSASPLLNENEVAESIVAIIKDITNIKLANETLENTLSILDTTLNSTVDGILVVDKNDNIIMHNKQFMNLWNLPNELVAVNFEEFVNNYAIQMLKNPEEVFKQMVVIKSQPWLNSFAILRFKDGRTFERFSSVQMNNGQPSGRVWTYRDITRYEQLKAEILESKSKLALAMNMAKLAHWEYNVSTDQFLFNDQFYGLLKTTAEREGGYLLKSSEYAERFLLPEERFIIKEELELSLKTKNPRFFHEIKHSILCSDGEIRHLIVRIAVVIEDGVITKTYGANQDVTELVQTFEALQESEKKYRKIFDYVDDVFYRVDKNGFFTELSPSIYRYTGYTADELVGKPITSIYFNPDERNKMVEEIIENKYVTDYQIVMKNKNGDPLYVSVSAHVLSGSDGEYIGIEGSLRDVSERKKNENKIIQMNGELKDLNATKDKIFSIIAHDLRSPFQGILGYTQILSEDYDELTNAERIDFIKGIDSLSKGTYKLLDNLLQWSRLQTGKMVYSPESLNLFETLHQTIELLKEVAREKDIDIETHIGHDLKLNADSTMLETVVRNLISNAIKFTNPNGKIIIAAEKNDDSCVINVEDDGVGISKENIEKLFKIDKGITTKGTSGEQGTGLGLLLCKEMIDLHSGKIFVESEPGKGTKFSVVLPFGGIKKN